LARVNNPPASVPDATPLLIFLWVVGGASKQQQGFHMKVLLAMVSAFALLPSAGWAKDTARPDPADPAAAVPPFKYESTFHGYMPHQDAADVSDWRDTNFDRQVPGEGGMGHMHMPDTPAQPQNGGGSSGNDMHDMHK
jgi:hypothetical protein